MTAPGAPVVVVVTNGNFFSNIALRQVLAARREACAWHVLVTTGLRRPKGNRAVEAWRLFSAWGVRYTAYKVATYAVPALGALLTRRPLTVLGTCKELGIPTEVVRNVNAPDVVERVAQLAPVVLVSYSCPYRIRSPLLATATAGSVNVHSSLLPKYAGVCTYVHVLANGESETGVTVHEMVEEFDAGMILAQEPLPIPPRTSVLSLFARQSDLAGRLLGDAIDRIVAAGSVDGQPQDPAQRTYFGEPTKGDVAKLRRRGHRLLRPADIRTLLTGRS